MLKNLSIAACVLTASATAYAEPPEPQNTQIEPVWNGKFFSGRTAIIAELEGHFGGDTIETLIFEDGETQDLTAGEGLSFNGGVRYLTANLKTAYTATIGYKFSTNASSNSDAGQSSIPIAFRAYRKFSGDWHVSGGFVMQTNWKYDGDESLGGSDVEFDNAPGFAVGIGWKGMSVVYQGLTGKGDNGVEYDASSIGFHLSTVFLN